MCLNLREIVFNYCCHPVLFTIGDIQDYFRILVTLDSFTAHYILMIRGKGYFEQNSVKISVVFFIYIYIHKKPEGGGGSIVMK